MDQKAKEIEQILDNFNQELGSSMKYSYHVSQFIDFDSNINKTEIPLETSPDFRPNDHANQLRVPGNLQPSEEERNREISFNVTSKNPVPLQQQQSLPKKKQFNVDRPRTYMDSKDISSIHFVAPKKVTAVLNMTSSYNQVTLADKNFRATRKVTQKLEQLKKEFFVHKIKDIKSNKVITIQEEEVHDSEYNPYLVPYRLDLAILHEKASQFGLEEDEEEEQHTEEKELVDIMGKPDKSSVLSLTGLPKECPCCYESIEKKKAGLCFSNEDVKFLGHGFPLYFRLIKAIIFLILIPFILLVLVPHAVYLRQICQDKDMHMNVWTYCSPDSVHELVAEGFINPEENTNNNDSHTEANTTTPTHLRVRLLGDDYYYSRLMHGGTRDPQFRLLNSEITTPSTDSTVGNSTSTENSTTTEGGTNGTHEANGTTNEANGTIHEANATTHETNGSAEHSNGTEHEKSEKEIEEEAEIMITNSFLLAVEKRLTFDTIFLTYFVLIATAIRIYGLRYIRKHNRGTSLGQFTVLVKNIPIDCEEEEIRDFFQTQPLTYKRSWLNRKLGLEDNALPEDTQIEISEIKYVYNFADLITCNKKIISLIKTRRKLLAVYSNIKGKSARNFQSSFAGQNSFNQQNTFKGSFQSSFAGNLPGIEGPDAINEPEPEKKPTIVNNNGDSFQSNYTKNSSLMVSELKHQAEDSKKSFIWEKIEAGTIFLERHLKAIDQEIIDQHDLQLSIIKALKENTAKELGFRFCGQVFVSFTNAKVARKMVQIFRALYDQRKRKFRGKNRLVVEPASGPDEIIWENLGIYSHKKIYIRLFTFTLELLMLSLTTFIVFIIYNKAESEELEKECGIAILVLTINKLFMKLISHLVEHERHKTKATVETLVVMFTLPLTLVNILVFELIEYGSLIISQDCLVKGTNRVWEMGKITHKLLFVNVFVSIGEPLLSFIFDYSHFTKLYHRFKIKREQGYKNYCQEEVNHIFEGNEVELHEYYSHTCISFCLGMFAAPFFPPSALICIVGLGLNYWLLKYNMLYRCKVESQQCTRVIGYFLLLLNLGPVFYMFSLIFISYYAVACPNYTDADIGLFQNYEIVCLVLLIFLSFTIFKWFRPVIFWRLDVKQKSLGELKKEKTRTYDHLKSLLKQK